MRVSAFMVCRYQVRAVRSPYKTSYDVVEPDRPLADPASAENLLSAIEV